MKPIVIVGGGLAGLTLGIALRQRRVPARVIEALGYPRHRVCGEFISGRGLAVLETLRLRPLIEAVARPANDAAFFSTGRKLGRRTLPTAALCVPRYELDAALARQFRDLGGELETDQRWDGDMAEGMVRATGRRRCATEHGFRWFGLKAHFREVALEADLEMHVQSGGYIGLCRLAGSRVNVCGLFRNRPGEPGIADPIAALRGQPGSVLHARLKNAEADPESGCAVAGLSLEPANSEDREARVGDALTMIPPITGNGMSMAFESAAWAAGPLTAYAEGKASWSATTQKMARQHRRHFGRRLFCARLLHRIIFSQTDRAGASVLLWPGLWRGAFALTR